jgi:hypothetical protein
VTGARRWLCRFHPGTRLALLQGSGTFSLEEWEDAAREVLRQDPWRGTRRILSDRRDLSGNFPPGMKDRVLAFFTQHAQALGEVQWAVVVPDNAAAFATVRLAAELSKATRVRVQGFTDLSVALQWLLSGSDDEQIAALTRWIDDRR